MKARKKIIIKFGTSTLTDESGAVSSRKINKHVRELAELHAAGHLPIVVTSGSVASGLGPLGWNMRPTAIKKLQAAAAVGQSLLMANYDRHFKRYGIKIAQVLITQGDMMHRRQYLNIKNTLETLLSERVVPIINENDTTSVEELKFGDNDTLAALVTNLIEADPLIILTNTDGMFDKDPGRHKNARLIPEVSKITEEIEKLAGGVGTRFGSGGMITKVRAAKIVNAAGRDMFVANASTKNIINKIAAGESCGTRFVGGKKGLAHKKLWIAYAAAVQGGISIDKGAERAVVEGGKSLLPAGVCAVTGDFSVGDIIEITSASGKAVARGVTNFDSGELKKIMGRRSTEAAKVLKGLAYEEVVHRDCLVVL